MNPGTNFVSCDTCCDLHFIRDDITSDCKSSRHHESFRSGGKHFGQPMTPLLRFSHRVDTLLPSVITLLSSSGLPHASSRLNQSASHWISILEQQARQAQQTTQDILTASIAEDGAGMRRFSLARCSFPTLQRGTRRSGRWRQHLTREKAQVSSFSLIWTKLSSISTSTSTKDASYSRSTNARSILDSVTNACTRSICPIQLGRCSPTLTRGLTWTLTFRESTAHCCRQQRRTRQRLSFRHHTAVKKIRSSTRATNPDDHVLHHGGSSSATCAR